MKWFIFIAACFSHILVIRAYTCDPVEDCKASSLGDRVPDPNDCESYYVCILSGADVVPSDTSVPCANGQYFDQDTGICQPETITGLCDEDNCMILPCKTTCLNPLDLVVNTRNCSVYYICQNNDASEEACPGFNPYFNGETCVTDASACCDICTSLPYCFASATQVADPYDCRKYYLCMNVGPVQESNHVECPSGYYFDFKTALCNRGSKCTPLCPGNYTTYSTTNNLSTIPVYSTTSTPPFCSNNFICVIDGNYPRCDFCDSSYFTCNRREATIENCQAGMVFDTNPCNPQCVPINECPSVKRFLN